MKQIYVILLFMAFLVPLKGQIYLDDFDDGMELNVTLGNGFTSSEENGEWTLSGDGTSGAYEVLILTPNNPDGTIATVDISENNKIYLRAKASNLGTQLRMDVKDADGYATTLAGLTKTLVSDYTLFEFDFAGNLSDGGYGGTSCMSADAPCPVDPTRIVEFNFYVNPGQGSFFGTIVMDFIAVGTAPGVGPASDVWQDHFDDDAALGYMGSAGPGLTNSISNSNWVITGDGTGDLYEPVNMLFYNAVTTDTIDVPVNQGNDKVFIRMKTSTPGTTVRLDLQDINEMATTGASITKPISEEWTTYEYNFAGSYTDLGFGGTGCSSDQAPCPVDSERVANMIIFINPGAGAFVGDVEIDYISIGTSLEEEPTGQGDLIYGDHFSGGDGFVATSGVFDLGVNDSVLKVTGDGSDVPYASISYSIHDMDTGNGKFIDATGNNKLFIRAKADAANTLLRVDLIDTAGYTTTLPSLTKLIEGDYTVLEFDYTGQYVDAGYGGTACESDVAPCPVDATAISTVLLYPNPADGGFTGCLEIDYISFGAPMGEDVSQYVDEFDNDNRDNWSDATGFTVEEMGGELLLTGDGTSGQYTAFSYSTHDTEDLTPVIVDMTFNNKLYVKAKSTVAGTPLRIDLVDQEGYATTEPATLANLSENYEVLEFDFTGTYMDGGYGGTPCMMGPCDVDGMTVQSMLFYIDPNNGAFAGTVTIDWISTIEPLEDIDNEGPLGVDDYEDPMDDNSLDFISDANGLSTLAEEGLLKIVGDGTSGLYDPIVYKMHDGPDSLIVNGQSNSNKLFIRAKSTVDGLPFRIDLQDNQGYLTSLAGLTQGLTTDFVTYEFDYTGNYSDGGYGGTACETGPCPVDGERLEQIFFYLDPGIGLFSGEVHIDWISFGEPYESSNVIDVNHLNAAKLYPNPTSDVVFLELNTQSSKSARVSISDISGKVVQEYNLGNVDLGDNLVQLDVSNQQAGFYLVRLHMDNQLAFVGKLIIRE
jgi:hypothetical protein